MTTTMLAQDFDTVAVADLAPHPENPRRGDVDAIAESIATHGWYGVLVVQRSTRRILVGNHRWLAARQAGITTLPVAWVDLDDDRARRLLLVENRLNELATNDVSKLAAILESLQETDAGLTGTGYDDLAAAAIIAAVTDPITRTDVDDAPDRPITDPITRDGDLWQLGPHLLTCGSALDDAALAAALDDEHADLVVTDPPYGVNYHGGTGLTIANDDLNEADLYTFLDEAFTRLGERLHPGAAYYICSPTGRGEGIFRAALESANLPLRQGLVWAKDRFVLSHADYHHAHESILYGWEPGAQPHYEPAHDALLYGWVAGAAHLWDGGRRQSTVWEIPRPTRSESHPTMKPVELYARAITNSSKVGGRVLDPFAGSGTALIACHHTHRVAALVELDPAYCDVICQRWEEHTGIVPIRNGAPTSFAA